MITSARIEAVKELGGIGWITCLRAPAIRNLAADDGPLQMSLFDQQDLAELSHPDYPGERRGRAIRHRRSRKDFGADLHGLDTGAGQDRVERCGVLPGPVADQEPEVRGPVTEVHRGPGRRSGRSRSARPRHPGHGRRRVIHAFEGTETIQTLIVGPDITGTAAFS